MTPPRPLEFVVKLLVPRAYREQVLGDLHERCHSRLGYLVDAATAVPAAIMGQIRRVTPFPFLVLEAAIVYGAFFAAARLMWEPDSLQTARISALIMAGLIFRDAYLARPNPSRWKMFSGIYHVVYFSCGAVWVWQVIQPDMHLFPRVMTLLVGLIISSVMLTLVREWIESSREDRRRGAR